MLITFLFGIVRLADLEVGSWNVGSHSISLSTMVYTTTRLDQNVSHVCMSSVIHVTPLFICHHRHPRNNSGMWCRS
jgi:hypothetical protein